jgi:mitogen-activated protein kinase kinase 7
MIYKTVKSIDIKPSNILIDSKSGDIKLCDFGISGNLINSNAFSRSNAGCAGYMAPERIDPVDPQNPVYDIRADVWSLGITLVELATGEYPYKNCHTEFEVMTTILGSEAPQLVGDRFSSDFKSFVNRLLTKDVGKRPKYAALLNDPFVLAYKQQQVDVKSWLHSVVPGAKSTTTTDLDKKKSNSNATASSDSLVVSGDEDGRSTRSLTPINSTFNNLAIS